MAEEGGPVPDRAGQRLRRQHLAHPDDPDRQGLFSELPEIKSQIKEFKVVSTGTDVAAQLGAIEDFINQGYDAIVTIAVSPEGFDRVIRLADKNGVVIVPFDNMLDTDKVMQVNEDQHEMGVLSANFLLKEMGKKARQDPRGPRPARQLGRPRPP